MVLSTRDGRVVVSVLDGVVKLAVTPAQSLAISLFLGVWSTTLVAMALFMVVAFLAQGRASLWLLLPIGFATLMVAYAASLLRWNAKGQENVEVSAKQVRYCRIYHPVPNQDVSYDDVQGFELWRPHQEGMGQFDFQIWRMGAWSLSVAPLRARRSSL